LDEAHAVKNVGSQMNVLLAERAMKFDKIVFTTATPIMNDTKDMAGYLKIVWRNTWDFPGLLRKDDYGILDTRRKKSEMDYLD
jgi:hypothetical protein